MSPESLSLIALIFLIAAIAIAFVKKINIGILGFVFAILIAVIAKLPFGTVVSQFPTKTFLSVLVVTMLFAFYLENGTVPWIAGSILYAFRSKPRTLPFVMFIIAFLLGAISGPHTVGFTTALILPVGFGLAMHPIHTAVIVLLGTFVGANLPFGQFGAAASTIVAGANNGMFAGSANSIAWSSFAAQLICYIIIQIIMYFAFKGYKLNNADNKISKPEPLNRIQKKSLWVIGLIIILFVLPSLLGRMGGVWKTISNYMDVITICIIGILINSFIGLADESKVIKNRLPMATLIMIGGMGALSGMANAVGVVGVLTDLIGNIPNALIIPIFVFFSGFMSFFASSLSVVFPTMIPIAAAISVSTGLSPAALFGAVVLGSLTSAVSPLSTGGSQALGNCLPEFNDPTKQFYGQFAMAVIALVFVSLLGGFIILPLF